MITPGLCSITFRNLTWKEITEACAEIQIPAIEWGSDVHARPGDTETAEAIKESCLRKGIQCPSYGSYFRAGETAVTAFPDYLKTAEILGCRTIRVWGGSRNFTDMSRAEIKKLAEDTGIIAGLAAEKGISISFEYHFDTATHTMTSLQKLDALLNHPNVKYYWQPPHGMPTEECCRELKALEYKLTHIHVFHWLTDRMAAEPYERRPLAEGREKWKSLLSCLPAETDRTAYLEFTRNDSINQLKEDFRELKKIISALFKQTGNVSD